MTTATTATTHVTIPNPMMDRDIDNNDGNNFFDDSDNL